MYQIAVVISFEPKLKILPDNEHSVETIYDCSIYMANSFLMRNSSKLSTRANNQPKPLVNLPSLVSYLNLIYHNDYSRACVAP